MLCSWAWSRFTNVLVQMCLRHANSYLFKYVLLSVKSEQTLAETAAAHLLHIKYFGYRQLYLVGFFPASLCFHPSLSFFIYKCRTIWKFLHQVIRVSWEQEKRLLILFNFPGVQCLRIALKHMAACLYGVQHVCACMYGWKVIRNI